MIRFRTRSSRVVGLRHVLPLLGVAFGASCGGDSTAPGVVPGQVVPDRVEILYAFDPRGQLDSLDLYVVNPDGSSNRRLISQTGEESFPSWSPDGRSLVYQHRENGVLSLWRANEDGTGATQIPATGLGAPRWSPDGSWIIFAATGDGGRPDVVAIHTDGTARRFLTAGISGVMLSPAAWSATGRIAFMRSNGSPGFGNLWTMNVDGSGLTQLTTGVLDQVPIWSPDGSLLAYTAWTPNGGSDYVAQVVVVNANGSGARVLTGAGGSTNNVLMAWSPDGQSLLYQHRAIENGQRGCWFERIPVAGGAATRIVPQASGAECGGAAWRSRRPQ